jgi:DNA-binding CsgD family transcriptional regulator
VGSIFRASGPDFSDREVEFLAAVTATLAAASRIAVRSEHAGRQATAGPVIVIAGLRGELKAATAAAATWLAEVEEAAPGRFTMTLHSVAAHAHASRSGTARARMRDAGNNWVVLQASRLITGDDPEQMVVTVEPATTYDLATLLLTAYGVTARERDVCLEVLSGSPTADIARNLFISPHTVHDHLKSLFGKVGVGSRGELVARLVS